MSLTEWVLKAIFSKRLDRESAINQYLSKFDLRDLSVLQNIFITSLEIGKQRRDPQPYGIHGNDPYPYIDLATYLFAKVKHQESDINRLSKDESDIRAVYRVEITKAFLKIGTGKHDANYMLSNFRLHDEIMNNADENFYMNTFTNLNRLYRYGTRAQLIE